MKILGRLAFFIGLLANGYACAESDTVPIENPVATFTRPGLWPSYPDDNGILTVSTDGAAAIDMIVANAADAGAAEAFALSRFASRRVTLFLASRYDMRDRRIGDRSARVVSFKGRGVEGPLRVVLILVKLDRPRSYLMISEQGAAHALAAHATEIGRMLDSIKLIK